LKFTKTSDIPIIDPSTLFQFNWNAFNNTSGVPANWDYDLDMAYNAALSTVTDQTTKFGTYAFKATNVSLLAGGDFKIRKGHDWAVNFGYVAANIKGDIANFVDDGGNIKVVAAATYSTVVFKYTQPTATWIYFH